MANWRSTLLVRRRSHCRPRSPTSTIRSVLLDTHGWGRATMTGGGSRFMMELKEGSKERKKVTCLREKGNRITDEHLHSTASSDQEILVSKIKAGITEDEILRTLMHDEACNTIILNHEFVWFSVEGCRRNSLRHRLWHVVFPVLYLSIHGEVSWTC